MKATQNKIDLFLQVADYIEVNKDKYDWEIPLQCSCGMMYNFITSDDNNREFFKAIYKFKQEGLYLERTWSDLLNAKCPIANESFDVIIDKLSWYDITPEDIVEIEYFGKFVTHSENNLFDLTDEEEETFTADNAITYFRNKALQMQRDLACSSVVKETETQPVSV